MKPPPRKRARVSRTLGLEVLSRNSSSKWQQPEKRKLLKALSSLSKAGGGGGDLDYAFLKECIVTRSMSEIRCMVESLKDKVISGTLVELNKWKSEKKFRKPIEIWTDMAFAVTGNLEGHISTAFSQMLMVSSTEPCTLQNCDPPQARRPTADRLVGRTAPLTRDPRVQAQPVRSRASAVDQQPSTTSSRLLPAAAPPTLPSTAPPPAAETGPRPPSGNAATNRSAHSSAMQPSSPGLAVAPPPDAGASPVPGVAETPGNSRLSPSAAAVRARTGRTSKYATKDSPRTLGVKCVVDFEKIYRYLSAIHKPDTEFNLTPMESAILLDLLMSLPEEFPHLDCNKLRKHLVQVYKCLSSPASSGDSKEMLKKLKSVFTGQTEVPSSRAGDETGAQHDTASGADAADVAAGGRQKPQPNESSPNLNTSNRPSSTDVTEFSPPPLNPFMIPSFMLMRK